MTTTAEQELRDLVDARVAAVHAKDRASLTAAHAADVVAFNVLPPLQLHGPDEIDAQTEQWFAGYPGPIGYDVHELQVHADGDVGFCSFLYHVTGTLASGDDVDMWVRATLGCRRVDGAWKIVHDHESVPFDPQTGQALIGLAP